MGHNNSLKTALLFHGQGLPPINGTTTLKGKTQLLDDIIMETDEQTEAVIGHALFEQVRNSGEKERTENTLLAQLAAAYEGTLMARALFHHKPSPSDPSVAELYYEKGVYVAVAGHSVGQIIAAGFEPVVSETGEFLAGGNYPSSLRIIRQRGELMLANREKHPNDYRMAVVVKKGDIFCHALLELVKSGLGPDKISISGHNSPEIHTFAGEVDAVAYAVECARLGNAYTVGNLNNYGFHCEAAMHVSALGLRDFLEVDKSLKFRPYFPVVSSRNAKILEKANALQNDFWRGVEEPVMWHCDNGKSGKPSKKFVIGSLIGNGYRVHITFSRDLKGWESDVQKAGLAEVIAVTDYASLVAGRERLLNLVKERNPGTYRELEAQARR